MQKVTNKISCYWALQLLSLAFLCNLAGLCQAEISEVPSLRLEVISDISAPPNGGIWATIANTSATVVDPTQYQLVVAEMVLYKNGKKKIIRRLQQAIPLKSLLDAEALPMSEMGEIVNFASKAHKSIASSPELLAYVLTCRIEDNQSQRVSNAIQEIVLTDNAIVQERVDYALNTLARFLGCYVANSSFGYLYQNAGEFLGINASDLQSDIELCYEILGLSGQPTQEEITKAHRELALQHHPDKHPREDFKRYNRKTLELNRARKFLLEEAPEWQANPQKYQRDTWLQELYDAKKKGWLPWLLSGLRKMLSNLLRTSPSPEDILGLGVPPQNVEPQVVSTGLEPTGLEPTGVESIGLETIGVGT